MNNNNQDKSSIKLDLFFYILKLISYLKNYLEDKEKIGKFSFLKNRRK